MATGEFEESRDEVLQKLDELKEALEEAEGRVNPQIKGELGGLWKEAEEIRNKTDSLDRSITRILKCKIITDFFSEEEINILKEILSWYNFWGEKGHLDKLRERINELEKQVDVLWRDDKRECIFLREEIKLDAFKAKVRREIKHIYSFCDDGYMEDGKGALRLLGYALFDEDILED